MTYFVACHHLTTGCRAGVQQMMWISLTIGRLSEEDLVLLGDDTNPTLGGDALISRNMARFIGEPN